MACNRNLVIGLISCAAILSMLSSPAWAQTASRNVYALTGNQVVVIDAQRPPLLPLPATIDSITFTILNTNCGTPDTLEFFLNGVSLGTVPADDPGTNCTCAPNPQTFSVTDMTLLSNWSSGSDTLRVTKTGFATALAWVRATITSGASSFDVVVFDQGGGNADVINLCSASFTFGAVDSTASLTGFLPSGGTYNTVIATIPIQGNGTNLCCKLTGGRLFVSSTEFLNVPPFFRGVITEIDVGRGSPTENTVTRVITQVTDGASVVDIPAFPQSCALSRDGSTFYVNFSDQFWSIDFTTPNPPTVNAKSGSLFLFGAFPFNNFAFAPFKPFVDSSSRVWAAPNLGDTTSILDATLLTPVTTVSHIDTSDQTMKCDCKTYDVAGTFVDFSAEPIFTGGLQLVDTASLAVGAYVPSPIGFFTTSFDIDTSTDMSRAYVAAFFPGRAEVYDQTANVIPRTVAFNTAYVDQDVEPFQITVAPDGNTIYYFFFNFNTFEEGIRAVDAQSGQVRATIPVRGVTDLARCCQPGACPLTQGFWKNHSEAWPVKSLTLGSQTYTQSELLTILNTPVGSGKTADASLILAHQLIAAKLNIANGSDPSPVDDSSVAAADSLLSGFTGKLPYAVSPKTTTGQDMVSVANTLDNYNNGLLTPICTK